MGKLVNGMYLDFHATIKCSYYKGEIKHYERKGEAKPECTKKEMKDSKAQLRQFLFTY